MLKADFNKLRYAELVETKGHAPRNNAQLSQGVMCEDRDHKPDQTATNSSTTSFLTFLVLSSLDLDDAVCLVILTQTS